MRRTAALFSVALLVASQAGAAPAPTDATRSDSKSTIASCSTAKHVKKAVNACDSDDNHDRTAAYVFAGALAAGVIAIAVSTTGHHHITASP